MSEVIAFTTSTDHGSVAIIKKNKVVAQTAWTRKTQGGEVLNLKIKTMLTKAKLKFSDIKLVAVDKGPGSFTGCRIAANVAKTMAYSLKVPIYAGLSLDILAEGFASAQKVSATSKKQRILCALDAHKNLFYANWYEVLENKIIGFGPDIKAVPLETMKGWIEPNTIVVGALPAKTSEELLGFGAKFLKSASLNYPQAKILAPMAALALDDGQKKNLVTWSELEPTYIRAPEVVERLSK